MGSSMTGAIKHSKYKTKTETKTVHNNENEADSNYLLLLMRMAEGGWKAETVQKSISHSN